MIAHRPRKQGALVVVWGVVFALGGASYDLVPDNQEAKARDLLPLNAPSFR
jgi:hypothetical protein